MVVHTEITGIAEKINTGMDGLDAELLLVIPGALGVAVVLWGVPKAVKFFKSIAR